MELAQILIETLTEEQIDRILQAISDKMDDNDGCCPLCDGAEYPVEEGSEPAEWREEHADKCIVTLIEQHRKGGR